MEIDRVILLMLNEAHSNAINAGMAISRERGDAVLLPGDSFRDAIFASRDIEESVEVRLVVAEDTWRWKHLLNCISNWFSKVPANVKLPRRNSR